MFKDNLLKGKRILITGGGTGLGKEIAQKYLQLGADLWIAGRRGGVLDATAKELTAQHAHVLVGLVERASREYVRTGEERGASGALEQEGLGAQAAVAQQEHRGRGTREELVRHFRQPGRRGPCRSAP